MRVKKNEPYNKLTDYFLTMNHIEENTPYEIVTIPAKELIQANRIDLLAKVNYIRNRELGLDSSFFVELYKKHIEAFSEGKFIEEGTKSKNSVEKYIKSFDETIDSISMNGFDSSVSLVPIGKDNVLLDGAHRVAACIYFDLEVTCIRFKHLTRKYDLSYFKERYLQEEYLDFLCNDYCKVAKNVYCFCFWPTTDGHEKKEEAVQLIDKNFNVLYKKELSLTYNGYKNFMIQVYRQHPWVGNYANHYEGVYGQLDPCYVKGKKGLVVFVEAENCKTVLTCKNEIRNLFQMGNYSIHSTDNKEETRIMAELVLNRNSTHFMNYGKSDLYQEFYKKIDLIDKTVVNKENIIMDSSSVLGMYGIREPQDVDYLTTDNNLKVLGLDSIDCHNEYVHYYEKSIQALLMDPSHYFTFNGMKFITLETLRTFKQNRNENKDKNDVECINQFLKYNKVSGFSKAQIKVEFARGMRNTEYHCRQFAKKTLKLLGIHQYYRQLVERRKKKE